MKREKKVLVVIFLIGVIIISLVGLISAGWLSDLFKIGDKGDAGEGELAAVSPSKARVDVTLTTPPVILFVSDPNRTLASTGVASYFSYSFVAYSIGGLNSLPQTPTEISTRVSGGFNGTFGNTLPRMRTVSSMSCGMAGIINDLGTTFGAVWNGKSGINYTCVVKMLYYYDPGIWSINASVIDDGGNLAFNNSKTFTLQDNPAWVMSPDYINWTGISVGGAAKHSNNNLTINNTGNINISVAAGNGITVNATFLNGTTTTTEGIIADSFKASEYDTCNSGTSLSKSQFVTITSVSGTVPFVIDHVSSTELVPSNKNLTFCLGQVSGISPQRYETLPGQTWTIKTAL